MIITDLINDKINYLLSSDGTEDDTIKIVLVNMDIDNLLLFTNIDGYVNDTNMYISKFDIKNYLLRFNLKINSEVTSTLFSSLNYYYIFTKDGIPIDYYPIILGDDIHTIDRKNVYRNSDNLLAMNEYEDKELNYQSSHNKLNSLIKNYHNYESNNI